MCIQTSTFVPSVAGVVDLFFVRAAAGSCSVNLLVLLN